MAILRGVVVADVCAAREASCPPIARCRELKGCDGAAAGVELSCVEAHCVIWLLLVGFSEGRLKGGGR